MTQRLFLCYPPFHELQALELIGTLEAAGCEVHCDAAQGRLVATLPDALVSEGRLAGLLAGYEAILQDDDVKNRIAPVTSPEPDGRAQGDFVVAWQLPLKGNLCLEETGPAR